MKETDEEFFFIPAMFQTVVCLRPVGQTPREKNNFLWVYVCLCVNKLKIILSGLVAQLSRVCGSVCGRGDSPQVTQWDQVPCLLLLYELKYFLSQIIARSMY